MGRIKTKLAKRVAVELWENHKDLFKKDFGENKKIVANFVEFPSKKLKNIVAGYATRLAKPKSKTKTTLR